MPNVNEAVSKAIQGVLEDVGLVDWPERKNERPCGCHWARKPHAYRLRKETPMLKQVVDRFAGMMLGALLHAGPRPGKTENNARNGWIDDSPLELRTLLGKYGRRLDLEIAHLDEGNHGAAVKQCVNIANAAMMLADVLEREAEAQRKEGEETP